ncbi:hypothetical protein SESBI_30423 [Sesbania bispinosa]|nr:hypothetical protein SESBI_30423 [Sesbania bispinosa]
MRELLTQNGMFKWGACHQEAFDKIKGIITTAPVMSPPIANKPLRIYLAVTKHATNDLIAQEKGNAERPAHTIHVMSKSEGIRYLLQNAAITGRMSRWALLMSDYDVQLIIPSKLGCQALVDMMSICTNEGSEVVTEEIRGEVPEVNNCEEREEAPWIMKFDGTPSAPTRGAGVVLIKGGKEVFAFSHQLTHARTTKQSTRL